MQKQKNVAYHVFNKEKKLYAAAVICLCSLCLLCGCTKKEELILLTQDARETKEEPEVPESGRDVSDALGKVPEASAGPGESTGADESAGAAYIVEEQRTVYVHVCGAVVSPGVYELPAGSRVYEAVQAAGGFAQEAEESYVNQAQELADGAKLFIPTVEEAAKGEIPDSLTGQETGQEAEQASAQDGRININTASAEELCRIPGIGTARAAAVISYREEHGGFEKPEDIMKVSGIKESTYGKIKDSISVK